GRGSLSEQLLAYTHDLQKKLQELRRKRERLRLLSQAKSHCQRTSFVRRTGDINVPINGSDGFTSVRVVYNVGSKIRVFVNAFKRQVELSSILQLFGECGVEVESALLSTFNDKVFYTFQCKISDVQPFDCNVIYGRIWRLLT
ncbi:hypothetical protein KI387_002246, partial [Taxus chinensis]